MKQEVPIWEKANRTIVEAAACFGIGMNKLRPKLEIGVFSGAHYLMVEFAFRM